MIAKIRDFLDAVASPGGNLLILVFCVFVSGLAAIVIQDKSDQVDTVFLSVFSGFTGALLQALTTGASGVINPKPPVTPSVPPKP